MECNVPTDIAFSFTGLRRRGGLTGPHGDGWGLALYEGRDVSVFREPRAAANSRLAKFLTDHPTKTLLAVGHVRQRTRGATSLANTHPFTRELWGRRWVFAHNGTLRRVRRRPLGRFEPLGTTDSEHAFCHLMSELERSFSVYPRKPSELWAAVAELGAKLGEDGTFNFLLGDGSHLYARCGTRLSHLIREAPFGPAQLRDAKVQVNFAEVTTARDRVAVVATAPLTTNERWVLAERGELRVFRRGRLAATFEGARRRA